MVIKIKNRHPQRFIVPGADGKMHIVSSSAPKLRFAPRTAKQEAAVAAPAEPTAQVQQTRVARNVPHDPLPAVRDTPARRRLGIADSHLPTDCHNGTDRRTAYGEH